MPKKPEQNAGLYHRSMPLILKKRDNEGKGEGAGETDPNLVRAIASTGAAVDWGGWRETLLHGPENVDVSGAASCLFNHDRDQPIGGVKSASVDGAQMTAELDISPDATAASGVKILEEVRKGRLRGISIGYDYRNEDCDVVERDDGSVDVTVRKWSLREISITPTPADIGAQIVRSLPESFKRRSKTAEGQKMNDQEKFLFLRNCHAAGLSTAEVDVIFARNLSFSDSTAEMAKAIGERSKKSPEAPKAGDRSAMAQEIADIAKLARTHGLEEPEKYAVMSKEDANAAILRDLTTQKIRAGHGQPTESTAIGRTTVGTESIEKARDAAISAILARAGVPVKAESLQGNPFAGKRALEMGKRWAAHNGHPTAHEDWSEKDVGEYMLGRGRYGRSANVSSGMFDSYVLANVMDKAVSLGFSAFGANVTYPKWTRTRQVSDFKSVTGAALDVGNLKQTVENAPFPEMGKAEFGYTAQLAMWGVTASLSLQTLINDDLGEFINQIFRSGQIANRTIEKEVYTQLEAATWTNNTTGSAGLGTGAAPTPGNLDLPRKAFLDKTGPAGEKLGNIPKYLIHTPSIALPVNVALGLVPFYGGAAYGSIGAQKLEGIESPYLTGTSTTYYLVADPALADTVVLLMLNGMTTPQVEEYDPGAVAARKWKIYLPFTAKPVASTVTLAAGGTANIAPGLQQATI